LQFDIQENEEDDHLNIIFRGNGERTPESQDMEPTRLFPNSHVKTFDLLSLGGGVIFSIRKDIIPSTFRPSFLDFCHFVKKEAEIRKLCPNKQLWSDGKEK